ncbi:MAG: SRPBCC family protein [Planctomycetes bacterium]|nr:SRPBCC family protein [Planctomycetota bacterium]
MLQLPGEEHFSQPPAEVWACLADANFLAKCLPGLESTEQDESGLSVCRVRPGLSFFKGTLEVTLDIRDQKPPDSIRICVNSKGIGASAVVETSVELSARDTGTQLDWNAEVTELGGLLKPIGRSLIAAAAHKVIAQGWSTFLWILCSLRHGHFPLGDRDIRLTQRAVAANISLLLKALVWYSGSCLNTSVRPNYHSRVYRDSRPSNRNNDRRVGYDAHHLVTGHDIGSMGRSAGNISLLRPAAGMS